MSPDLLMELNKESGRGKGGIRAPLIGLSHISTVYEALSDSCKSDMHLLKCFSFIRNQLQMTALSTLHTS